MAKTPSPIHRFNQVAQLLGENHFAIADATQHATEAHHHAFRIHQRCDVGSDPKSRQFFRWLFHIYSQLETCSDFFELLKEETPGSMSTLFQHPASVCVQRPGE